ncbi:MAG: hypothetical protein HYS25_13735 [Ignavibacteriales bacterium]|nr:hypothetical protein [Ignavibacteriales bacterium]
MNEKLIPITCTGTQLIEVALLKPIQGKLKSRTREQLYKLRSLIFKHGFSFPVFVWFDGENYFTLDGHGRDFLCKELLTEGWRFKQKSGEVTTSIPCDFIDAKDRVEAKEKLLALNSGFGKITEEGLHGFIFEPGYELNLQEVKPTLEIHDIDLMSFENIFFTEPQTTEREEYHFAFSQEQIKGAIKKNFPKFESVQDIVNGVIDIPLAMHQFNKLCSGNKNTGSDISLLFNPHRLEVNINNRKYSAAEQFINQDKPMINSLAQWMSKQADVVHHGQYINAAKANTGTQIAHEFKPYLAREIYSDYCKEGARVLDPCAGWGGRMIGFVAAQLGGEYTATDPSAKTYKGLLQLRDFLLSAASSRQLFLSLHNQPFEDLQIEDDYFDFAFTSPPYFDTEQYSDEDTQAYNRYKTLDEFNEKFLTVLIRKTMSALKPGACFLLNIGGCQFRFDRVVNDICHNLGLKAREVFDYKIGRGEHFVKKYKGDQLENTVKANDLFFEIRQ